MERKTYTFMESAENDAPVTIKELQLYDGWKHSSDVVYVMEMKPEDFYVLRYITNHLKNCSLSEEAGKVSEEKAQKYKQIINRIDDVVKSTEARHIMPNPKPSFTDDDI